MEKIESFKVNHLEHPVGIYLSRTDGDIFSYDVRLSSPYKDKLLSNATLHSLEHLLATVLRNSEHSGSVIYAGPMGCQTGFYVLFRAIELADATQIIVDAMRAIVDFEGEMPGGSKIECGNYQNLDIKKAKAAAKKFLKALAR